MVQSNCVGCYQLFNRFTNSLCSCVVMLPPFYSQNGKDNVIGIKIIFTFQIFSAGGERVLSFIQILILSAGASLQVIKY